MTAPGPAGCRACGVQLDGDAIVLDLGDMPPADLFPLPDDALPDPVFPLAMAVCGACGLLQLVADPGATSEPRAVEPQALRRQAARAVDDLVTWLGADAGGSALEFGSPHGGSWLPLLAAHGWTPTTGDADVIVDTFGLMHEPDQRAAIAERAERLAPGGLLLLFHSAETILRDGQWSALRHGHYAYWSLTALVPLLAEAGLAPVVVWEYPLYGGTLLVGARLRSEGAGVDPSVRRVLARENAAGVADAGRLRSLQAVADAETAALAAALAHSPEGMWAYGAASRAVAVLARAGATSATVHAVADAAPAKQGRTLPTTRIPIVSPDELIAADPPLVALLLPDLLPEVERAYPALAGRFVSAVEATRRSAG